jgi:hypothetical protein
MTPERKEQLFTPENVKESAVKIKALTASKQYQLLEGGPRAPQTLSQLKIKKGNAPPFNVKDISPKDRLKFQTAATLIQAHTRGYLARLHRKKALKDVPHKINVIVGKFQNYLSYSSSNCI